MRHKKSSAIGIPQVKQKPAHIFALRYAFLSIAIIQIFCFEVTAQGLGDFTGSFKSWANLKKDFGAVGNGKTDDTKSFQKALDRLGAQPEKTNAGSRFTVLYVPAGIYNISSTLVFKGKIGVVVVGEDPANTIIKWVGGNADTMFWANGSAFYKIARFTWDANGRKDMEAIGIHWKNRWKDGKSQSYAALNIELSDHIFTGKCKFGISGGTSPDNGTGNNDSEITIRRCVFKNCTEAGLHINGYNALDYWVWDCQFLDCNVGIRSYFGNFHVYRSYFRKSAVSDVFQSNGYYSSIRGCYSEGSRAFSLDDGFSVNPFKRIFQQNTVVKPWNIPVQYYHWGKLTALDNSFDASTDSTLPMFFKTGSWGTGSFQVLSVGNRYKSKNPVLFTATPNKLYSYKDGAYVKPAGAVAFTQQMTASLKKAAVAIFEIPVNADEKTIQSFIDKSGTNKTETILHFSAGTYTLHRPLTVSAGSFILLVGDGALNATIIQPAADFPKGKALIQANGENSTIGICEMQLGRFDTGKKDVNGIEFTGVDQAESQAFIDQLYSNATWAVHAQDLDHLYIEKDNSFFADGSLLSGGPLTESGKGTSVLYGFGGQYAGVSVTKNAKAVLKDCWWEGGKRIPLSFSGSGNITIDGAMVAPNRVDSGTTIDIQQFSGKISLMNMYLQGAVAVNSNNPSLRLLMWNIHSNFTLNPFKFFQPASNFKVACMGFTAQCFVANDKKCETVINLDDQFKGVSNNQAFILDMIGDDRAAMPRRYVRKNATNIYISRVSIGDCATAIRFRN